jgi:hypothetical protein
LLRLNAFQVRCDGVSSAKGVSRSIWLNIAYFESKGKVFDLKRHSPVYLLKVYQ